MPQKTKMKCHKKPKWFGSFNSFSYICSVIDADGRKLSDREYQSTKYTASLFAGLSY